MNNIFHTENVEIILLTCSLLPDNQNGQISHIGLQDIQKTLDVLWQIENMSFISLSGLHVCGKHTWSDKLWISSISVRPCSSCGTAPGSMSFSAENNRHVADTWCKCNWSPHFGAELQATFSLHTLHCRCWRDSSYKWKAAICSSNHSWSTQPRLCKYSCRWLRWTTAALC